MDRTKDTLFFETPAALRRWLEKHHNTKPALSVGFHKTKTKLPSVTWPQAVDQALAFGWIDGLRQSIDSERYRIRFTSRKPKSVWSRVNLDRFAVLQAQGLIAPAGQAAFGAGQARTGHYSYENAPRDLPPEQRAQFEAATAAWSYFQAQPPSYRKAALWWVTSAKQAATRDRRLATLIEASAAGQPIAPLNRTKYRSR